MFLSSNNSCFYFTKGGKYNDIKTSTSSLSDLFKVYKYVYNRRICEIYLNIYPTSNDRLISNNFVLITG